MKIIQLQLLAFGPFKDTVLDLGEGDEGFHMIYGRNEAGKSAALRAIHQVFYGIPERSMDNFIHPYARMRIGAMLQRKDGTCLRIIRRKGRANTLRAGDDETLLDEGLLNGFLSGVSADIFKTMFGMDHDELVRGGQEIIKGGGNIGQILFASGSGISDLHKIQGDLLEEAKELFKPSGQTPKINAALTELRQNQKKLRDAQLPGRTWLEHDQGLRSALEGKVQVEKNLKTKQRDRHRLERIKEALPGIARRKELQDSLASYTDAILLTEDFGDRRIEIILNLRVEEGVEEQTQENIKSIQKALEEIEVPESLLDNVESIERIYQELGSHRKAATDRTKLVTQMGTLESEAKGILSDLRLDVPLSQVEKLRVGKAESVRIQELGNQHERLVERLDGARDAVLKLSRNKEKIERKLEGLADPKDIGKLERALKKARQQGNLEEQYRSELIETENTLESMELTLGKQTLWSGTLGALEKLPNPSLETIDVFETRFGEARGAVMELRKEIDRLERGLMETDGEIKRLRIEQEVPTEEDLREARRKRDRGWLLVRRLWLDGERKDADLEDFLSSFEPANTLAEAYEVSVIGADEVADRLRREADRVEKRAILLTERETNKEQLERMKSRLGGAEIELAKIDEEWSGLWQVIKVSPKSPREMRAWAQDMTVLAEEFSRIRQGKIRMKELKSRIELHRKELGQGLQSLGETLSSEEEALSDIMSRSELVIEHQKEIKDEREQLLRDLDRGREDQREAESTVDTTEKDLSRRRIEWAQAIQPLGLEDDATPSQAGVVMADIKSLLGKLKETEDLGKRVEGIDKDAGAFTEKVANMVKRVARDLKAFPIEQIAVELNARLTQARAAKTNQQNLQKQRRKEENKLRDARHRIVAIGSKLHAMCEEAGCSKHEELIEAEKRSTARRQLESEMESLSERLHNLSAGATIEDFVKEARAVDPDGIDVQIEQLSEQIEELNRERSSLDQTIGTERNEVGKMDGSGRAADLAENGQRLMAGLESDILQYVRLRLASTVLGNAVERYREKHQGPVLRRANALFAVMTCRSFEGMRVEYDEKGNAVLVGVRSGGTEIVGVEGMSEGTADQLYFALRLASLETYLEKNEPLPFIVDDTLISFDDQRAVETLKILESLAGKTQVIFFTHHRHLLDLAEANIDPSVLHKHSLGM